MLSDDSKLEVNYMRVVLHNIYETKDMQDVTHTALQMTDVDGISFFKQINSSETETTPEGEGTLQAEIGRYTVTAC